MGLSDNFVSQCMVPNIPAHMPDRATSSFTSQSSSFGGGVSDSSVRFAHEVVPCLRWRYASRAAVSSPTPASLSVDAEPQDQACSDWGSGLQMSACVSVEEWADFHLEETDDGCQEEMQTQTGETAKHSLRSVLRKSAGHSSAFATAAQPQHGHAVQQLRWSGGLSAGSGSSHFDSGRLTDRNRNALHSSGAPTPNWSPQFLPEAPAVPTVPMDGATTAAAGASTAVAAAAAAAGSSSVCASASPSARLMACQTTDEEGPTNIGSRRHAFGTCVPCKFFRSRRGCKEGERCKLCHHPHEEMTYSSIRKNLRRLGLQIKLQYEAEARNSAAHASTGSQPNNRLRVSRFTSRGGLAEEGMIAHHFL